MKEFIRTHKTFSFYTSLVLLVVLVAIFSPFLTPNDPFAADLANALKAPSEAHWFGTDKLGRDVLSRIIYGTGLSLFMGFTIVFLVASIGTVVGSLAGYFGGKVEWYSCVFVIL